MRQLQIYLLETVDLDRQQMLYEGIYMGCLPVSHDGFHWTLLLHLDLSVLALSQKLLGSPAHHLPPTDHRLSL